MADTEENIFDEPGCESAMDAAHKDLYVPEFKPSIPSHMLKNLNSNNKFLMEQLSVVKNQNQWQTHTISKMYKYTRQINDKVIELEHFKQRMLLEMELDSKWDKREKEIQKFKKWLLVAGIGVLYPVYIFLVNYLGLGEVIEAILKAAL